MGNNITFSVVITVLNEAGTIKPLIESLIRQIVKPAEIIIVDAGSTDGTADIISALSSSANIPIRILVRRGVNRSLGRNIGIQAAGSEFIAVTDAGCVAHADWLFQLAKGFSGSKTEAVAGFYDVKHQNSLQQVFSWFIAIDPKEFNSEVFLPSSRSVAFTKKIWKKVGGYPEHLNTCEDLVFAAKLKQLGSMKVRRHALVQWKMPESIRTYFRQVSGYAFGDVVARYQPHIVKQLLVWIRYLVFLYFPFFILLYPLFPVLKMKRNIVSFKEVLLVVLVQLVTDVAVMWGGLLGVVKILTAK
jgi:glycosyltransferase involved in cell wall biosynthesis